MLLNAQEKNLKIEKPASTSDVNRLDIFIGVIEIIFKNTKSIYNLGRIGNNRFAWKGG